MTNTNITTQENTNITDETSKFALSVGIGMAALVGFWGFACLFSGIYLTGIGTMITGLFGAVIG